MSFYPNKNANPQKKAGRPSWGTSNLIRRHTGTLSCARTVVNRIRVALPDWSAADVRFGSLADIEGIAQLE